MPIALCINKSVKWPPCISDRAPLEFFFFGVLETLDLIRNSSKANLIKQNQVESFPNGFCRGTHGRKINHMPSVIAPLVKLESVFFHPRITKANQPRDLKLRQIRFFAYERHRSQIG